MSLVLVLGGAVVAVAAPAAAATFSGSTIVNAATASGVIGTPYLWGGGHGTSIWSPGQGIDCSGLTRYAYAKSGIDLGAGATYNQIRMFDNVGSVSNAVAGDLIFYGTPNATNPDWGTWDVTHVAIYLGSGTQRVDALPSGGVQVRSSTSMTRIGYFHIKSQYASGGSAAPAPRAPAAGEAWEAASTNSWVDLPMGPAGATSVAATSMNGVKYVYTMVNGQVWEAASDNGWISQPTGILGASAVAVTSMNGVKYVYTNVNGQVWEAASNNSWINQPTGIPAGAGLAVTSMSGVKYVYTLVNGIVWEAASNNSWISQPTGVPGSAVSVTSMGGVKYIYTLVNGQVWEAASDNSWISQPTGILGASTVAVTSTNGVKYVYTVVNGQVWEAASNNSWINQPSGVIRDGFRGLAATTVSGAKFIYSV